MIAVGGTIASVETKEGLRPEITSEEILTYIPEVSKLCQIDAIQLFNIDSTNVYAKHWKALASCIEENYAAYDGFVVTHGTDTLAYTAAALSYFIQNSRKPIVITGSQVTIAAENTDARDNLLNAFIYAADDRACGVHVIFDNKVILGTRARKSRTKSYNAFSSIDYPQIAIFRNHRLVFYIEEPKPEGNPIFYHDFSARVFVLKMIPGIDPAIFDYLKEHYDAVVIESFGVGGLPSYESGDFYSSIEKWISMGKVVVMTTQVTQEGSNMSVYEVGQKIKNAFGLIESYDMTLEATVTKLMWILGQTKDHDKVREMFYETINHDILWNTGGR